MNTTAVILLALHFVFSLICGWVVCRTYNKKSAYFFKGFLLTFIFGFIGALYFLRNLAPDERKEIVFATFVSLALILLVLYVPFLKEHRLDILIDIPFLLLMVVATIHAFIKGRKDKMRQKLRFADSLCVNYVLSYVSVSLVCLLVYVCVKAWVG